MFNSLWPHGLYPAMLLCLWDSPGKNTGVGCHALLQGTLPDSGIEPMSLVSPALAGKFFTPAQLGKPLICSLLRSNKDILVRFRRKKGFLGKQQINFSINMSHAIFVFYLVTLIEDTTGSIPKGSIVLPCDI